MLPANVDFPCQRGQTFKFSFGLRDSASPTQPYDITGLEFLFQARYPGSDTILADWTLSYEADTLTYDSGTGVLSGDIPDTVTAGLSMRVDHLEYAVLVIVAADSTDSRLMQGNILLSKEKWSKP